MKNLALPGHEAAYFQYVRLNHRKIRRKTKEAGLFLLKTDRGGYRVSHPYHVRPLKFRAFSGKGHVSQMSVMEF